jgi:4'-phosphopantetheinyl transferase
LKLSITEKNIDIRLTFHNKIVDEQQLYHLYEFLLKGGRCRQLQFHFFDCYKRYTVMRTTVRNLLSSANAYGRPAIVNHREDAISSFFNLAVGRHRKSGGDVENLVSRVAPIDIADRFFSPVEASALLNLLPVTRPALSICMHVPPSPNSCPPLAGTTTA